MQNGRFCSVFRMRLAISAEILSESVWNANILSLKRIKVLARHEQPPLGSLPVGYLSGERTNCIPIDDCTRNARFESPNLGVLVPTSWDSMLDLLMYVLL